MENKSKIFVLLLLGLFIFGAINVSAFSEDALSSKIVLGESVRWIEKVDSFGGEIEVPKFAENINLRTDKEAGKIEREISDSFSKKRVQKESLFFVSVLKIQNNVFFDFDLFDLLREGFSSDGKIDSEFISGIDFVIVDSSEAKQVKLNVSAEELFVEYYTPAPEVVEVEVKKGKDIKIFTEEELGYENVLAFTYLEEEVRESSLSLYHVETGKEVEFVVYDLNRNGLVDYIEWEVPHLSEQNYELRIEVLNPLEYLRDGDTWKVYFETTGVGDLIIYSTNANFEEISEDDLNTNDEMEFLDLKCGRRSLLDDLYVLSEGEKLRYLDVEGSVKIDSFLIENYSCLDTGEFSSFMNIAGYAILNFTFSDESETVSDLAVDPSVVEITDPTTSVSESVTDADNITVTFNFLENGVNATSGVTLDEITIGGQEAIVLGEGGSGGATEVLYDTFPTIGTWTNWVESGEPDWVIEAASTGITADGSYVAHADNCDTGCTLTSDAYDLTSYDDASLKFNWGVRGIDSGEYIQMDYYDGSSWNIDVWEVQGASTSSGSETINLTTYGLGSNSQIRFVTLQSAGNEWVEIDIVNITGISAGGGTEEFSYISGVGWQANVTVPSGLSGLQDLFVNATYNSVNAGDTETDAVDYGGEKILELIDPTTSNPVNVSGGENVPITFNFLNGGSNVTSGVSLNNVTIGGEEATIFGGGSSLNATDRTCSEVWGASCLADDPAVGDYSFDSCAVGSYYTNGFWVDEATVNASVVAMGDTIKITCNYDCFSTSSLQNIGISYYNGSSWDQVWYQPGACIDGDYSVDVVTNGIAGEQYARCSIGYTASGGSYGTCMTGTFADNDDVNFTVIQGGEQVEYISGVGWQTNVTVPSGLSGLQDLFVNATYSNVSATDTETNAISYPVALNASNVILNSTSGLNSTSDNLTINYPFQGAAEVITDWRLDGSSLAVLNMPFDVDYGSVAKDYSTEGNNETITGATWTSDGKVGGAYDFDGNDYISLDNPVLGSTEMTICTWAKKEVYVQYAGLAADYRSGYELNFILGYENPSGTINFYAGDGSSVQKVITTGFTQDEWHFVCGVFDGGENILGIYLDGTSNITSTTINSIGPTQSAYSAIGRYYTYEFNGMMDEVKIFDSSLSAEQINAMYQDGLANHSVETLVSQETSIGDNYTVMVTSNNGTTEGESILSNSLEIIVPPISELQITDPTTSSPESVSDGDNITVLFDLTVDDVDITSGVSLNDVTIGGQDATVLTSEGGGGSEATEVFYDTFTTTSWGDWTETVGTGWNIEVPVTTIVEQGTYVAHADACGTGCTLTSDSFDLSSYNDASLTFNWGVKNLDASEYIQLDFYDGSSWNTDVWSVVSASENYGAAGSQTINLTSYGLASGSIIRFVTLENLGGDSVEIDIVNITGIGGSGTVDQFEYVSGVGWQVNVTVPSGLSGLQDLFVNATYSSVTYDDIEVDAINYGVAPCSTLSGDRFVVKNSTGGTCFEVDTSGNAVFWGNYDESCDSSLPVTAWRVQGISTNKFWIDDNCLACIAGEITNSSSISYGGVDGVYIKNSVGDYLMKLSTDGDLNFSGDVCYDGEEVNLSEALGYFSTWTGKINTYKNDGGSWASDPGCDDGSSSDDLAYCQSIWPGATTIREISVTATLKPFYDWGCASSIYWATGHNEYECS